MLLVIWYPTTTTSTTSTSTATASSDSIRSFPQLCSEPRTLQAILFAEREYSPAKKRVNATSEYARRRLPGEKRRREEERRRRRQMEWRKKKREDGPAPNCKQLACPARASSLTHLHSLAIQSDSTL